MASWAPTRNVVNLTNQLNRAFSNRDKTSDGTIGDTAHQGRTSGHNPDDTKGSKPAWDGDPDNDPEVRAKDIDSDFRTPGVTAQKVVDHMRRLPNFDSVCRYLIYNGYIYHERDDFAKVAFDGDPHREHIHFEGAWSQSADNNGSYDFRFEELTEDYVDAATIKAIAAEVVEQINNAAYGKGDSRETFEERLAQIDSRTQHIEEWVTAQEAKDNGAH